MAAAALMLFVPELLFVPVMQHGMNGRTDCRAGLTGIKDRKAFISPDGGEFFGRPKG
jgi:hypothetical protein